MRENYIIMEKDTEVCSKSEAGAGASLLKVASFDHMETYAENKVKTTALEHKSKAPEHKPAALDKKTIKLSHKAMASNNKTANKTKTTSPDHKPTTLDHYGDLLSVTDLSNFLGISKQTVYKEIKEGKFGEPIKFGREFRVAKVYIVDKYICGNQKQPVCVCEGHLQ